MDESTIVQDGDTLTTQDPNYKIADTTTVCFFYICIWRLCLYHLHELIIDNDVKGTEGSYAGIYFNAGADTDGSKVSTARTCHRYRKL